MTEEWFGKKSLLTEEDHAQSLHDRSQHIAQEIFNHIEKTYRKTDGSGVVSMSVLAVSAMMAKTFSEGQCDKEMFVSKAGELYDNVIAVKG